MPSGFPRQVARLSAISLLSSTRTSTLQSRSIPRQLLHDLISISSLYALRPSDSQARLTKARKDRFLPIVNSDAKGYVPSGPALSIRSRPCRVSSQQCDRFPTLDLKRRTNGNFECNPQQ